MMTELFLKPIIETDSTKYKAVYELLADYKVEYCNKEILIPQFFQYDGASIPRLAWPIIGSPYNPKLMEAAIVHDWLFYVHILNRNDTNRNFYNMLLNAGMNKRKAKIMWISVQYFGYCRWANDELDLAYMVKLKQRIIEDGRNPLHYGLSIPKAAH